MDPVQPWRHDEMSEYPLSCKWQTHVRMVEENAEKRKTCQIATVMGEGPIAAICAARNASEIVISPK